MHHTYKRSILSNIEKMEANVTCFKNAKDLSNISTTFNQFIDLFVSSNNLIEKNKEFMTVDFIRINDHLSDLVVQLVDIYNSNNQTQFTMLIDEFVHVFDRWKSLLKEESKYEVVILGLNEMTLQMEKIIDSKKAQITCYIDENGESIGKFLNGKQIRGLNELAHESFDYIVSVSANEKVVKQFEKSQSLGGSFINYLFYKRIVLNSPEFFIKYSDFLESKKNFTGLLTGLSYTQKGVYAADLKGNFFNFANPSQDLFYDFEMFKYTYRFKEVQEHLKYAIIGLSYYSFHYDLSKSANQGRVNYYYPLVKSMHNNEYAEQYSVYHKKIEELENKFLSKDHLLTVFEPEKSRAIDAVNESYTNEYDCQKRSNEELLEDINLIKKNFNKNYPRTVLENKAILKEYLEFLTSHSIKPILLVCPVTKLYQAFTPSHFIKEFYEIIEEFQLEYQFQVLDYYSSDVFNDSHFYDPSHINLKGAKKLSELLNRDLNW